MTEPDAEDLVKECFTEARRVFDQGRYEEAIPLFEKTIRVCTTNQQKSTGFNLLGVCYARLNNLDEAIIYYNTAVKFDPKSAHALVNRGLLYHDRNDLCAALRDYDAALELKPDLSEAYATKGTTLLTLGKDPAAALVCFKKASALAPKNSQFLKFIGDTYLLFNAPKKAIKYFARQIRLIRKSAGVSDELVHVAQCYAMAGDMFRAFKAGQLAVRCDPKNSSAHEELGDLMEQVAQYSFAVVDYVAALRYSKREELVGKITSAARKSKLFHGCVGWCQQAMSGKMTIDELVQKLDRSVAETRQEFIL